MPHDDFRFWAREQFKKYRGAVGFMETLNAAGDLQGGTCFHVGEGVFVTARHVVENHTISEVRFDDDSVNQHLLRDRKHRGKQSHGRIRLGGFVSNASKGGNRILLRALTSGLHERKALDDTTERNSPTPARTATRLSCHIERSLDVAM